MRERGGDSQETVQELEELFAFLGSMCSVFTEQILFVCNDSLLQRIKDEFFIKLTFIV